MVINKSKMTRAFVVKLEFVVVPAYILQLSFVIYIYYVTDNVNNSVIMHNPNIL